VVFGSDRYAQRIEDRETIARLADLFRLEGEPEFRTVSEGVIATNLHIEVKVVRDGRLDVPLRIIGSSTVCYGPEDRYEVGLADYKFAEALLPLVGFRPPR